MSTSTIMKESHKYTEVKIASVTPGWNLDAWRYIPQGRSAPYTVIVMAHGLSCNKSMGLKQFAEIFAEMGYAAVVFDYRRWGTSDGKPRSIMRVEEQLEDYRTVIKYCRQQPEFDPNRLVVWGTSFGGGHAVSIAAERELNVYAAISQCPFLGITPPQSFNLTYLKMGGLALLDSIKLALGLEPVLINASAPPGSVGVMTPHDYLPGFKAVVDNVPGAFHVNKINASSVLEISKYFPHERSKTIQCPLLLVQCDKDTLCLSAAADAVARNAPKSEVIKLDGGHFDIYPGLKLYAENVEKQKDFLRRHVPV